MSQHPASDAPEILTKHFTDAFLRVVLIAQQEIQFGGPITGALGSPVDEGGLRGDWRHEIDGMRAVIGNTKEYATVIETGIGPHGPLTLRSEVGGFHSLATVTANIDRIVVVALAASEP